MSFVMAGASAGAGISWQARIRAALEKNVKPGKLGLYVKDLQTGEELSLGAENPWYLASGVKVPIAIELLSRVEEKELRLADEAILSATDYVDGSGHTNDLAPGTAVTLEFLLEEMLVHSDNTASDILIRRLGLDAVNARVQQLVPRGFEKITTLADVRRLAFAGIFPEARRLESGDLLALKNERTEKGKVRKLASILRLEPKAKHPSLKEAFTAYYSSRLNSATLVAYGELLRKISDGTALGPWGTAKLLEIMGRVETGKNRVRAGLGEGIHWAHKTGTQYERVCDFGLAWRKENPGRKIVIAACAVGYSSLPAAERSLRHLGEAVKNSGLL